MIKLSDPCISEAAIERAAAVLRSGNLVQGKIVAAFEESLAAYLHVPHAVLVSSGTSALHLALHALGIGEGDEVIVPAFSFPATANVVELTGAAPVLVDITLDDCGIDARLIERAVTPRTKAIMPVHEFGQPADWAPIEALAGRLGIPVVEDAACALGAVYGDRKIGTLGALACFSFHPRKTITTGEGGCVTTASDELAARLRALRNHGMELRNGARDFVLPGYNYRLTEFQAAIGLEQFERLDALVSHRREIASIYDEALSRSPVRVPRRFPERHATYQTYHLLLTEGVERAAVIEKLGSHDIEANLGAQAIHCQSFYAERYGFAPEQFPSSLEAYRSGLALPMGPHVDAACAARIAGTLDTVLAELL